MNHEFDEKSLERALRAPGSPAELNGEGEYLAMFRTARSAGPVGAPAVPTPGAGRRAARRFGTSTSLAVAFAVTSAGVAAAYSSNLPEPVQRAVHSVLSPLGVPAADPPRPVADPPPQQPPVATPTAAASEPSAPEPPGDLLPGPGPLEPRAPSMSPDDSPSMEPSLSQGPTTTQTEPPVPTDSASALPTETASASPDGETTSPPDVSPSGTPSTTPSTTPDAPVTTPPVRPASVRIASVGAGQKVAPGGTAVVTGRVAAADGSPVAEARVVLQGHGSGGWRRLAVTHSAADGSVAVVSGPITRTTVVRLRVERVLSAPRTLVVQPTVTATASTSGTVATITATTIGGAAGEAVVLLTRRDGRWVVEQRGRLDGAGAVRFQVPAPAGTRVYAVRLQANAAHAAAEGRVSVGPPAMPDAEATVAPGAAEPTGTVSRAGAA